MPVPSQKPTTRQNSSYVHWIAALIHLSPTPSSTTAHSRNMPYRSYRSIMLYARSGSRENTYLRRKVMAEAEVLYFYQTD